MSHTKTVSLIADQEIRLFGIPVNIHDIVSLCLDDRGRITEVSVVWDENLVQIDYGVAQEIVKQWRTKAKK